MSPCCFTWPFTLSQIAPFAGCPISVAGLRAVHGADSSKLLPISHRRPIFFASPSMSITYLALRRSSFMGMSGAGEPQVYDGSAGGKRGEDGSGRDRASQRKRHHAVASALLGEGERLVGAREQSVDALGTFVEARG